MRKGKILNSDIVSVIARMGKTDKICVSDCVLPIPDDVITIDLSVYRGYPDLLTVLQTVLSEFKAERYYLADEIKNKNADMYRDLQSVMLGTKEEIVNHDEFKEMIKNVKAVIRTGECSPYSNIILESADIY